MLTPIYVHVAIQAYLTIVIKMSEVEEVELLAVAAAEVRGRYTQYTPLYDRPTIIIIVRPTHKSSNWKWCIRLQLRTRGGSSPQLCTLYFFAGSL